MPKKPVTRPRKTASQDRSRATVDALLSATARVLVRDGYDHASTNKIADAAGVSIGSLYQYYPSKEALVAAVGERHSNEMLEILRAAALEVGGLPLEQAARKIIRTMIAAHRVDPKLHRVLVEQIPRVGNMAYIDSIGEEIVALVRAYLEAHRAEVGVADLDMAALLAVGAVEAMTHLAVLRRPQLLSDPSFVDELANLVVRYLRGDKLAVER